MYRLRFEVKVEKEIPNLNVTKSQVQPDVDPSLAENLKIKTPNKNSCKLPKSTSHQNTRKTKIPNIPIEIQ